MSLGMHGSSSLHAMLYSLPHRHSHFPFLQYASEGHLIPQPPLQERETLQSIKSYLLECTLCEWFVELTSCCSKSPERRSSCHRGWGTALLHSENKYGSSC